MSILKYGVTRFGNRVGVWIYQALDGRPSSGSKNVHVLMLTTPGRRTGMPHSPACATPTPLTGQSSRTEVS